MPVSPVTVSLEELRSGTTPFSTLEDALGRDSLGIIVVKDVDPEFSELRLRLLSYASYLAALPPSQLDKLENPAAKYLTGWSLGKETLKNGQVDTLKGSFYANCAFYVDPKLSASKPTPGLSAETFPEYLSPNVWPAEEALPGFKETLERLCTLIIDVAVLVAKACDRYGEEKIEGYRSRYLQRMVESSTTTKARLLHYFPTPSDPPSDALNASDDDWCATHLDHGCLTGLTSAMFIDEATSRPSVPDVGGKQTLLPTLPELSTSPDPEAGLYIQSRTGETVHVRIPKDCIAFQTGEALERITRGRFKAVPHYVKGIRPGYEGASVARNTLAVFTQPNLDELVDPVEGITFADFARGIVEKNTAT